MADVNHKGAALQELHMPFMINSGTPEGSLTGEVDDYCYDYTNSIFYRKDSGSGNTNWEIWKLRELFGDLALYDPATDGNPELRIGALDAEELHIEAFFKSGTATLEKVQFTTDTVLGDTDAGQYKFNVDGVDIFAIDDNGIEIYINVTNASPTINLGSSSAEALTITASYLAGGVLLEYVEFKTTEASGTADRGEFRFVVDGTGIVDITDSGIIPNADDGVSVGKSGTAFSDLFLATGGVIDWNATDKLTHSANTMTLSGFTTWDFGVVNTIDFDGDIDFTPGGGDFKISSGSASKPILTLESTNVDASSPVLKFSKLPTGSAADDDEIGTIAFDGLDDSDGATAYASIKVTTSDVTDGLESGKVEFKVKTGGGASKSYLILGGKDTAGGAVAKIILNDGQNDIDTEIYWDTGLAFQVLGSNGAVDVVNDFTAGTIKSDGVVGLTGNDVGALGASGTAFSDLFLASGAVINFDAGDVTLTHASNKLTFAGGDIVFDSPLSFGGAGSLTIATGVVAITQVYHTIVVENGTGSGADTLATATGGAEGDLLILKPATSGVNDTVTVQDGTGANTFILSGSNFAMNHVDDRLICIHNGTEWVELSRSDNS